MGPLLGLMQRLSHLAGSRIPHLRVDTSAVI